jgi:hypothetical protein
MFYNCKKLTGAIPWDIFYTESVEHLYTQLKDVSHMFHNCGFGTPTTYNDTDYFVHPEFFSKLIAITTTEGMFCRDSNIGTKWTSAYPIAPTAFNGQYFLTTIREMFRRCYELGGAVTNSWFSNSLSSITNCYGAFAYTKITNVDNLFLRASSESANTKITNVGSLTDVRRDDLVQLLQESSGTNTTVAATGNTESITNATGATATPASGIEVATAVKGTTTSATATPASGVEVATAADGTTTIVTAANSENNSNYTVQV